MILRTIFLVLLFSWTGIAWGQTDGDKTSGNIDTTVTQEPTVLNMDSINKLIDYPKLLRNAGIEGKVIIKLLVEKDGTVIKHTIFESPHALFTQEIEKHIYHLRLSPAINHGEAVRFWMSIPFNFKLKSGKDIKKKKKS